MSATREAWPQHLGTCNRCGNTYLLGTSCGDSDHLHIKERTMSNDNYPAGVTDAHQHFNPSETMIEVECTTEEALTVPSFAVKAALIELFQLAGGNYKGDGPGPNSPASHGTIVQRIEQIQREIDEMEREGEYECQWKGEMELPVSEEAEWDCPRCGVTQTTDTVPEDRDPDEGWDSRYDD